MLRDRTIGRGWKRNLGFRNVRYFKQNTNNVHEGLGKSRYPVRVWDFTEIFDSNRTQRSSVFQKRFWTISFNNVMIEIVFSDVQQVHASGRAVLPNAALLDYLRMIHHPEPSG